MSHRPPRKRAFLIPNFSDWASAKLSFYSDFLQSPVRKGAVFWTKKKSVISWSHWQPSWDLATLTTHHIHTISPISLTIFSLSRRLRTTVGQSPNIHTKLMGSWTGHRNHRSLLCLDWTHSLRMSCTLQNPILELGPNSSSGRGVGCGVEFYDCVKRGLNGAGVRCDHLNPLFNHRLCEPGQESLLEGWKSCNLQSQTLYLCFPQEKTSLFRICTENLFATPYNYKLITSISSHKQKLLHVPVCIRVRIHVRFRNSTSF